MANSTVDVDAMSVQLAEIADGLDCAWVLTAAALVVIMQVGFAYVEAGNVRVKNVRSILLKNTVDYVLGGLAFAFVANGIASGKSFGGFIGTDGFGGVKPEWDTSSEAYYKSVTLYSSLFACTTSTIISGAIAERMRLTAYMLLSFISPFVLYALPAHWIWNGDGFLNSSDNAWLAVSDFAGGAVVHATGGVAGWVAAWFVGPRIGRYRTDNGKGKPIEGHSVVLGGLGCWLIIFGWFGFNSGSSLGISTPDGALAASKAAMNTFIAVLIGALCSITYHYLILGKLNLGEMFNNMLAGAASITAGCGFVSAGAAVIIGLIGSVAYIISGPYLANRLRIDDPLGAISVHLFAAGVGFLLVGFFHETDGLFYSGNADKLVAQIIGFVAIVTNAIFWTFSLLSGFTLIFGPVRVEEKIELEGCDIELDGIAAYEQLEGSHNVSYTALCLNKEVSEHFDEFLKSIYCYNIVACLKAIEAFEKEVDNPTVDSAAEAQALYDNYICPDGSDPVSLPDWQVTQVSNNISKGAQLKTAFASTKQEIYSILDTTINTHFAHTPAFQKYIKKDKKPKSVAPLHFVNDTYFFRTAKKLNYGRARPGFDPFKKFTHTEHFEESDDEEDIEANLHSINSVVPHGDE